MRIDKIIRILGETKLLTPIGQASFAAIEKIKEAERIQKAFALACRILSEATGDYDRGMDVRATILGAVDTEQVCRVCGCTRDNACPGGCYWVEEDLCSACATNINPPLDNSKGG